MMQITVGFNDKTKARELGARVIDGHWCIPDSVSDENKKALLCLFGNNSHETSGNVKPVPQKENTEDLETVLTKSSLHLLLFLKEYGFPEDVYARERIFRRFACKAEGDYPVSYEGLAAYLPVMNTLYPEDAILSMVKKVEGGYHKDTIESCKKLSPDERGLLLFLLP